MAKRVIPGSITKPYQRRQDDFSPNLVGNQFTDGTSFLTFGNFAITTNNSNVSGEFFNTGEFSNVVTLESLQITEEDSVEITKQTNNLEVRLKTNPNKLEDYVYFSDAKKFIETEITDILNKWRGGIVINFSYIGPTVLDFNYNTNKNISYFTVPKSLFINPYNINTENLPNLTTAQDDISFIQSSFKNYEISNEYGTFPIINYTGNTVSDDYVKIETQGLAWPTMVTSGLTSDSFKYYIKPKEETLEKIFFSKLSPFQTQLLNRNSLPEKYTISLSSVNDTAFGQPATSFDDFTWPTSDSYNLDYNGISYGQYVEKLLRFSASFDTKKTNIMVRKLVADAIFEFDTPNDGTNVSSGQKMDKLIKIWGREYDKIKTYIDSISFANVITYDGIENTPDELIKLMASNLGFDTIQSFSDDNLLKFYQQTSGGVFNEQQTNMSLSEMDREFWRRLIINAWWLFKSKGTRKVIEFFLNLFNIDECLVTFDEIVYVAEQKLDYPSVVRLFLEYYGFVPEDSQLQVDTKGYPKILPHNDSYYFQLNGYWYDGGVEPNTKPDMKGNNPHFGPYDFGKAYFEKFTCILENFVPTVTQSRLNLLSFNYFTDYSLGSVDGSGQIIVEGDNTGLTTETTLDNVLTQYIVDPNSTSFYAEQMNEGRVENAIVLNAGRDDEVSNNGPSSFHINFFSGNQEQCFIENCPDNISLSNDGTITYVEQNGETYTLFDSNEIDGSGCCEYFGFNNYLNTTNGTTPCYWCPPFDVISVVPFNIRGEIVDTVVIINPDGTSETPTEACCVIRNGEWVTPTSIGPNNELILGTPYCKSVIAGGPADPNPDPELG